MEQQKYLIDTNAIIDYLGKKLPQSGMDFLNKVIDDIPTLSVISKIEVLGFNTTVEHYQLLLSFMNDASIIGLTNNIVDKSIKLRKNYKTKLPDAIIAALCYNLILITHNISDFKKIEELKLIDPHNL